MKLLLSTKNRHKLREIKEILEPVGIVVESVYDYVNIGDIEETGSTFEENAALKAIEISKYVDEYVIADDSGISVDYLGGAPGVYSARFAGKNATDDENNNLLLNKLQDIPFEKRDAKYECVIALAKSGRLVKTFYGDCKGYIGFEYRGENGFGYDPIFVLEDGRHMAELSPEEKNRISHRYKALVKLRDFLTSNFR
ncbi:MAG: XTP/dITP diphosphatase [Calditerrivibrio sp.]|nr:XTP/dITP diphosphatase [Calditerrivibrio sp.]